MSGWERQRRNRTIMIRHGRICHICGQGGATEVDHVVPLARGGSDTMDNLRPAHRHCHQAKTRREATEGRNHPAV
jgi:5-methylcytosine-specific restriction endonuclease McrA